MPASKHCSKAPINRVRNAWNCQQRARPRCEGKVQALAGVVEWLDTEAVTRQPELCMLTVIERHGKIAIDPGKHPFETELPRSGDQSVRIARHRSFAQRGIQLVPVVEKPVYHGKYVSHGSRNRLTPSCPNQAGTRCVDRRMPPAFVSLEPWDQAARQNAGSNAVAACHPRDSRHFRPALPTRMMPIARVASNDSIRRS